MMTASADQQVYQLVYLSKTKGRTGAQELDDILAVSRRNNSRRGVSGLLLYAQGTFLQILEGNKEMVEGIYSIISYDSRHTGVHIIAKRYLPKPDFPDWTMGFKNMDAQVTGGKTDDKVGLNRILDAYNPQALDTEMSSAVKKLIENFRTIWMEEEA